ncbi:hypothetical protein lerEdw1_009578 [Lerista edwardsae]|nr:hypothetical protein lerEdw1_009578 [Lerista edwardsae]
MTHSLEKGEFLPAIIHYLKSVGVQVQAWKASPSQGSLQSDVNASPRSVPQGAYKRNICLDENISRAVQSTSAVLQEKAVPALSKGVFGVPLHLLPLSERAEGVPQFLVNACELLRAHLHVEGLFRKCGSMTRIRALKARLEAGENCLEMALPCDVATLVKQFLRELPEPLIPSELQGALCEVQQQEDGDLRGPLTVLLTCLLPQGSAPTLRYLFTFLQEVATRSTQNKMDLANLAVVFAPNLFPSELCSKLDSRAEEQLQRQAAVIQALIGHATEIGTVPRALLGKVQAAFSDIESGRLSPSASEDAKGRDAEARRRRRRRRCSVGDTVTETLSKLKTGRALCNTPCQEPQEGAGGEDSLTNSSLKTSFNTKRKASDDSSCVPELSAKKRPEEPCPSPLQQQPLRASLQCGQLGSQPSSPEQTEQLQKATTEGPNPDSDKAGPSGWLLMKKAVMEALDGPPWPQRWAHLPSYKLKEGEKGSPNPLSSDDSCAPTCKDLAVPEALGNGQQVAGLSLCPDSIPCLHQEPGLDVLLGSRGPLDKTEGLLGEDRLPASPLRRHRALRRSLSWPEDLSVRGAAEQKETAVPPDEALIGPGGPETPMCTLVEAAQPDVEAIVAGMRQLGIPAVRGTRPDGPRSESSPLAPKPEPPEAPLSLANRLRHLNEVPKTGLKRLSLTFQRASPQADEGPSVARRSPPKRRGGRRFGRSVSHESSLPLQPAQEEAAKPGGAAAKRGVTGLPHKSPLQSFKACGQQIFLTRKHIALSFAGLRRKKGVPPTSPPNPEQSAAVSQEAVRERQNRCSAKSPRTGMPF